MIMQEYLIKASTEAAVNKQQGMVNKQQGFD